MTTALASINMHSGISSLADILTNERREMEYVLQPVLRYASEGMLEK
jgi:hemolysin D